MAKFLNIWHSSPDAPWPTDPAEMAKLLEMMFAAIDNNLKSGLTTEFGYFADGRSGYAIGEGETKDALARAFSFTPWIHSEMYEMIPYETGKEVMRGVCKAQIEAMAAIKR
jgi:hypothetical protein